MPINLSNYNTEIFAQSLSIDLEEFKLNINTEFYSIIDLAVHFVYLEQIETIASIYIENNFI